MPRPRSRPLSRLMSARSSPTMSRRSIASSCRARPSSAMGRARTSTATRRSRRSAPRARLKASRESSRRRASSLTAGIARSRPLCSGATMRRGRSDGRCRPGSAFRTAGASPPPTSASSTSPHHERSADRRHRVADRRGAGGPAGRHCAGGRPHRRDLACGRRAVAAAPRDAGARQCARSCPPAFADVLWRGGEAARDMAAAPRGDARDRPLPWRARRAGAGSVMAHYTRFQGPMPPVEEAREMARAAAEVGIRVTLAVFMRDRNPLIYGPADSVMARLREPARAAIEAEFFTAMPSIEDQIARVEAIAAAVESPVFSVQFAPNGAQWCSDAMLAAIAERSRETGRRVHMHLLETRYQRAYADRVYPEGAVASLKSLGLLTPRLTLAHCVWARNEDLDAIADSGAIIATNPSSNLHLKSGVAPIAEAIRRGCRVSLGVDASAFDEDDDILREMRLGHFLHGGWGFDKVSAATG